MSSDLLGEFTFMVHNFNSQEIQRKVVPLYY